MRVPMQNPLPPAFPSFLLISPFGNITKRKQIYRNREVRTVYYISTPHSPVVLIAAAPALSITALALLVVAEDF